MKLIQSITVREACKNINPRPAPHGMPTLRWRKGEPAGRRELKDVAWYRGHQAGLYDAYLTLKQDHPRIAEKFREAAGLDGDGNLILA